jgi:hypothetical protein
MMPARRRTKIIEGRVIHIRPAYPQNHRRMLDRPSAVVMPGPWVAGRIGLQSVFGMWIDETVKKRTKI